jgi:hypothetical protein
LPFACSPILGQAGVGTELLPQARDGHMQPVVINGEAGPRSFEDLDLLTS